MHAHIQMENTKVREQVFDASAANPMVHQSANCQRQLSPWAIVLIRTTTLQQLLRQQILPTCTSLRYGSSIYHNTSRTVISRCITIWLVTNFCRCVFNWTLLRHNTIFKTLFIVNGFFCRHYVGDRLWVAMGFASKTSVNNHIRESPV